MTSEGFATTVVSIMARQSKGLQQVKADHVCPSERKRCMLISINEGDSLFEPNESNDALLGRLRSRLKACKGVVGSHLEACDDAAARLAA